MDQAVAAAAPARMQRLLDAVERVGNRVPHPVMIFVYLIGLVVVLSALLALAGARVTCQACNPATGDIETATTAARSLLTTDGIRFMFTGVVQNFMNFNAVGVIIVAMVGVGVAGEAGLVKALIRRPASIWRVNEGAGMRKRGGAPRSCWECRSGCRRRHRRSNAGARSGRTPTPTPPS